MIIVSSPLRRVRASRSPISCTTRKCTETLGLPPSPYRQLRRDLAVWKMKMTTSVNPQRRSPLKERADVNLAGGVSEQASRRTDYVSSILYVLITRTPNILSECIHFRRINGVSLSLLCVASCPRPRSKTKRLQVLHCHGFDFGLGVSGSFQGYQGSRPFPLWKFICRSHRPPGQIVT
jgi:hypothetical protein